MSQDHPTLDRILDHVLERGPLPAGDAEGAQDEASPRAAAPELTNHLASCIPCRETEGWVRKLIDAVRGTPPPRPPDALIERAVGILREEPRADLELGGWSLATLVRQAFARPTLAGVRGGAVGRRMLYRISGGHVDLEISPAHEDGEHLRLMGQVIFNQPPPPSDLMALLWSDNRAIARTAGDVTGVFIFPCVAPGVYRLDILSLAPRHGLRLADLTVEVGDP